MQARFTTEFDALGSSCPSAALGSCAHFFNRCCGNSWIIAMHGMHDVDTLYSLSLFLLLFVLSSSSCFLLILLFSFFDLFLSLSFGCLEGWGLLGSTGSAHTHTHTHTHTHHRVHSARSIQWSMGLGLLSLFRGDPFRFLPGQSARARFKVHSKSADRERLPSEISFKASVRVRAIG